MTEVEVKSVLGGADVEQYLDNYKREMIGSLKKFHIDDGYVFQRRFFFLIKDLCRAAGEENNSFSLMVIRPHPIKYFKDKLDFMPAVTFLCGDNDQTYIDLLNMAPKKGNIADSISSRADLFTIAPKSLAWMIWVDRVESVCFISCKFDYEFSWE